MKVFNFLFFILISGEQFWSCENRFIGLEFDPRFFVRNFLCLTIIYFHLSRLLDLEIFFFLPWVKSWEFIMKRILLFLQYYCGFFLLFFSRDKFCVTIGDYVIYFVVLKLYVLVSYYSTQEERSNYFTVCPPSTISSLS